MYAAAEGCEHIADILIEYGCNMDLQDEVCTLLFFNCFIFLLFV